MPRAKKPHSPFRYLNSSSENIRLVVMMYVGFPLSLRNVEDLLAERGIGICHETVHQMVEQVWADVCSRCAASTGQPDEGLSPVEVAPR